MDALLHPAPLLVEHLHLFTQQPLPGPVLDLACGEGHNGIFLARQGIPVVGCDRSAEALAKARELAKDQGLSLEFWQVDLEVEGVNPLPEEACGGIMVFRYLHRPLIPCIRKALREGGLLVYETFTIDQPRFGRPHNPDFLLQPGELKGWFWDWETLFYYEGLKENPLRAVSQIICRKLEETKRKACP